MKFLLALLLLTGCTQSDKLSLGDCYKRTPISAPESYQYLKIVKIQGEDITYIYNFPNDDKFERGRWYTAPHDLNTESKHLLFETKGFKTEKVECPW